MTEVWNNTHARTRTFTLVGVFYTRCWNHSRRSSQGKLKCAFVLTSSQHKEAAWTLKFSGRPSMLLLCTLVRTYIWLVIHAKILKRGEKKRKKPLLGVYFPESPLFAVQRSPRITWQITNWMSCSRNFCVEVIITERVAINVEIFTSIIVSWAGSWSFHLSSWKNKDGSRSFAWEKGHRRDKWMCALARVARLDKSHRKMRVSASRPTANAIMEMRSANQHT